MLFSKSCEYGIRALLYLSYFPAETKISIREISDKLDISFHFLTKILQVLTHNGIIYSYKGSKGGVCLAKPSAEIVIYDVIVAIDSGKIFSECVLGLPGCGHEKPCPLHHEWVDTRNKLEEILKSTSLHVLADKLRTNEYRLADDLNLKPVFEI